MCVVDRAVRIGTYILTPHNYVAFCLANRFRKAKLLFSLLAILQVAADFASCVALAMVFSAYGDALATTDLVQRSATILFNDDGRMSGSFSLQLLEEPSLPGSSSMGVSERNGTWALSGDDLALNWNRWDWFFNTHTSSRLALAFGYSITATGFVLFFAPASVVSLAVGARDSRNSVLLQVLHGVAACMVALALLYVLGVFIMLADGVDIWCDGFVGRYPCPHGTCSRGRCVRPCTEGFSGPTCDCTPTQCSGHGSCSGEQSACVCEPGYSGDNCTIATPDFFESSKLITPWWGERLNKWAALEGRFWEPCYTTFAYNRSDLLDSDTFHDRCDSYATTVSVARNSLGDIFGGFAVGSWDVKECCSNPANLCRFFDRSGQTSEYVSCDCAKKPWECFDRGAEDNFVFALSPGEPRRFLPLPSAERDVPGNRWSFQYVIRVPKINQQPGTIPSEWPWWSGLALGAGNETLLWHGGSSSSCHQGGVYDLPPDICTRCNAHPGPGCTSQGFTDLEVWRLRSL